MCEFNREKIMNSINLFLALSVMIVSFSLHAYGLECHVCREQETNNGKCQNTVKICEQDEDACLTEIKWGSPPYWSQGALKQYYITKRCAKLTTCERMRKMLIPYCTNIWYQDWRCSDCCQGDRCNYFVFLSGSLAKSSALVISFGLLSAFAVRSFLGS